MLRSTQSDNIEVHLSFDFILHSSDVSVTEVPLLSLTDVPDDKLSCLILWERRVECITVQHDFLYPMFSLSFS